MHAFLAQALSYFERSGPYLGAIDNTDNNNNTNDNTDSNTVRKYVKKLLDKKLRSIKPYEQQDIGPKYYSMRNVEILKKLLGQYYFQRFLNRLTNSTTDNDNTITKHDDTDNNDNHNDKRYGRWKRFSNTLGRLTRRPSFCCALQGAANTHYHGCLYEGALQGALR